MREIRLYSSEGGEVLNPLSLPLSQFRAFPLAMFLRLR